MNSKQLTAALASLLAANGATVLAPGKRYEGKIDGCTVQAFGAGVVAPWMRAIEADGTAWQAFISAKTGKLGKVARVPA